MKLLWYDGQGMCLFSKRLERGHFVWPMTDTGRASRHRPIVDVARGHRLAHAAARAASGTGGRARVLRKDSLVLICNDAAASACVDPARIAARRPGDIAADAARGTGGDPREGLIIAALQRNRFGRRSEQLDDATVQHGVEDLEQSVAEQTAAVEAAMPPAKPAATGAAARPPRTEPAKRNRGAPRISLPTRSARADQRRSCLAHVIRGRRRHHQVRFSAGVDSIAWYPVHFEVNQDHRPRCASRSLGNNVSASTDAGTRYPDFRSFGEPRPAYR